MDALSAKAVQKYIFSDKLTNFGKINHLWTKHFLFSEYISKKKTLPL